MIFLYNKYPLDSDDTSSIYIDLQISFLDLGMPLYVPEHLFQPQFGQVGHF